jgi:hypothetical protein
MIRQSVVGIAVVAAVVALSGCSRSDAPPGPAGPTLSLVGASGVAADLRRTVTQVDEAVETTLSVVDTSVWAPFDEQGAAVLKSGVPGSIGWLAFGDGGGGDWSRYASFEDSSGTLHQLWVEGRGRGVLSKMLYRRGGVTAIEYEGQWIDVPGGWVLDAGAFTFHSEGSPAVRLDIEAQQMHVTQAVPGTDALMRAGAAFAGLLRPQPLAAQLYFGACSGEWLAWGGAALIAQFYWVNFLKSKTYNTFRRAMAATMAAGVALSALVDCMASQGEQPDPGT